MKIDEVVRLNELLDAYKSLLSDKQQEFMSEFVEYNLSLSEIAENRNTSRQASFITLKQCIKKLEAFESKLGLIKKNKLITENLNKTKKFLEEQKIDDAKKVINKLLGEN